MGLFGKNYWHQSSADLVKSGIYYNTDGSVALDIRGDKRLLDLTAQIKQEIETAKKAGKELTEKQICTRIGELMHSDKYYGPYDKGTVDAIVKGKEIEGQIREVNNDDSLTLEQKKIKLAELSTKLENHLKQDNEYYGSRGGQNLKDYPKGKLVCREESVVMSYVMHQVGIPNRMEANIHGDSFADRHLFIQSDLTQAIIESTDSKNSYIEVINGGNVSKGQIAITADGQYYGNGKGGIGFFVKLVKAGIQSENPAEALDSTNKVLNELQEANRLKAHEKYSDEAVNDYKKNPNLNMDGVSVKQAARIQDGFEGSLDVGVGGWRGGKGDHELTVEELMKGLEKSGCKLKSDAAKIISENGIGIPTRTEEQRKKNQSVLGDKMENPKDGTFNYTKDNNYTDMTWLDKNHDGKLTMKEIRSSLTAQEVKIAEQYGLQTAIFCHNHNISNAIDVGSKSR